MVETGHRATTEQAQRQLLVSRSVTLWQDPLTPKGQTVHEFYSDARPSYHSLWRVQIS